MALQSMFANATKPVNTTGFNVPQGWSAVDNNSNDLYRNYLGFGRKKDDANFGIRAAWLDTADILGDFDQNKLYNQQQDQAFADKFKDQQIIRRMIGEGLYEYGLLGKDGAISNNWTHQYSKDNWLDKNMPALTLAAMAAMTGAGLFGQGGALAGAGEGMGAGGLSGMDLAADAALGSGNNIFTAGQALGGASGAAASGGAGGLGSMYALGGTEAASSGLLAGTGTTGLQATLGPNLSLAAPTGTGMGLAGPGAATAAGGMGAMDVLKGLGKALIGGQAGGISGLGNLASLFTNYKQYSNTGDLMDEIKSIYSPDGVYAKELEKQLARRDAAAGRNSQYGPRLAELMARLGDSQARSLSGLGGMMSTQQGGLNGMVGAGSRLLESTGVLEKLFSIFGD